MPSGLRVLALVAIVLLARPIAAAAQRHDCTPDPDAVPTGIFELRPAPSGAGAPSNLATACVGQPYSQTITIVNPREITYGGVLCRSLTSRSTPMYSRASATCPPA